MENVSINITKRKDGRYMGKFIIGCDENGKAQYQYVYGRTYDETEHKVLIGREDCITIYFGQIYHCRQGL